MAAHSLQRRGSLAAIARNHHVYTFPNNRYSKAVGAKKCQFVSVGTKSASTFPGLCGKHDHLLFREIETDDLRLNYRVAVGHAFRAVLFEAIEHTKSALWLDFLCNYAEFDFYFNPDIMKKERENIKAFSGYCWRLLERLQKVQSRKSPKKLLFAAVEFDGLLPFSATGSFCIELDFDGEVAQDFSTEQYFNYAQISVVRVAEGRSGFILSALTDQNEKSARQFIKSFLRQPKDQYADCALRGAICHLENVFFAPNWIDSLASEERTEMLERFEYGTDFRVGECKEPDSLRKALRIHLDYPVLRIVTNVNV